MPKSTRAPVISLVAVRQARSSAQQPQDTEDCSPYDIMEAMINTYFSALSAQLEKLKAENIKT